MLNFLKWITFSIFIVSVFFFSSYFQNWLLGFSGGIADANIYFFSKMPPYILTIFVGFVIVIIVSFVAWLIF